MNGARSWLLLLAISLAACSSDEEGSTNLFGPGVEQIILEVDYEAGAAPFDAYPRRAGSPWELLEDNLEALFAERLMGEDTVVFGQECLDDAYAAADAE